MPADPITAAGGVPWRGEDGKLLLGLVHRPRYDDWSFPKGKLHEGERALLAAVREVTEETGLDVLAGRRLPTVAYESSDGPKQVEYWSMPATGEFVPNDETDELAWLPPEQAQARLSYADDRDLVADLLSVPAEPVRFLLIRHASAGNSDQWPGPDVERPLDTDGTAQARALAEVLPAFGPQQVLSAAPVRCRQTVQALADRLGIPVGPALEFGEDEYLDAPDLARSALTDLLAGDRVSAVCSQGGVIPDLLAWLLATGAQVTGVPPQRLEAEPPARKGGVWALTAHRGRVVSADYYASFLPPSQLNAPD